MFRYKEETYVQEVLDTELLFAMATFHSHNHQVGIYPLDEYGRETMEHTLLESLYASFHYDKDASKTEQEVKREIETYSQEVAKILTDTLQLPGRFRFDYDDYQLSYHLLYEVKRIS